jgi:hypothetical protein
MAELLAAVSIAASILHLIEFSSKVIRRLDEFQAGGRKIPRTLQNLKTKLAVLRKALAHVKNSIDAGLVGDDNDATLRSAVRGCQELIQEVDDIITRILPSPDDSKQKRVKKVLASFHQEAKISRIIKTLNDHIRDLTFYFVVKPATPRVLPGTTLPTPHK